MKSRRKFIQTLGATALLPCTVTARDLDRFEKPRRRALRIAHITDVHLLEQPNAKTLFSRVLQEINGLRDKPDFIINTGDSIMDANEQSKATVTSHWTAWNNVLAVANSLDMYHALGNHDVWYVANNDADTDKSDKRYGKQWALEMLKLQNRYYSFTSRGWKFICLDSINGTAGYFLDDEQFDWLEKELADTTLPTLVFSHVPILSMGSFLYYTKRKALADITFPFYDMHNDHQRIVQLFQKHKHTRLALSGHIHYVDSVEYSGVRYCCNGAVSGNWWGTPIHLDEFPPVYAIIDLYNDGTSTQHLIQYNTRM